MSAKTNALGRRMLAGVGALALAAVGLFGTATAAQAEDDLPPLGNVDLEEIGSITVHKLTQPDTPGTTPGTGEAVELPTGAEPISGVEFEIYQADIDLSVAANWADLDELEPPSTAPEEDLIATGVTVDGVLTFGGLEVGVYYIYETDVTGAVDADGDPITIVGQADPFVVVIPTAIDGDWVYDVHAYPKNAVGAIEKDVDESEAVGLGDVVSWPITASIPTINKANGDEFKSIVITDQLDSRLTYQDVTSVTYDGGAFTDFTVTHVNGLVTFTVNQTGLTTLTNGNGGGEIKFVINTVVNSIDPVEGSVLPGGVIENYANLDINGTDVDSNEVETWWGAIKIVKTDADNDERLEGAVFEVYATQADAAAETDPIEVDGETQFETGSDGTVIIPGLLVGENNTAGKTYWLKEVAQPEGYQLIADPISVTVTAGGTTQAVLAPIDNEKVDFPELPITGANGALLFGLGGAAVVAIGLGLALRARRARA